LTFRCGAAILRQLYLERWAMTLSSTLVRSNSLGAKALMVLGGSLFIAAAAQVTVPMYPVPVTLQTLAVLLVGFAYGARLGAVTLLAYLAEGAMGLPVFAGFANGAAFFGPTAGFLVGFVGMAWLAGLAADAGVRRVLPLSVAAIVISALLYVPGAAWPMAVAGTFGLEGGWVNISASGIWTYFMAPFLIGDAVKAVLAAVIVTGAWKAVARKA